jgi:hypothetical protein
MRYSDENFTKCNSELTLLTFILRYSAHIYLFICVLFSEIFIVREYSVYLWSD